MLLLYIATVLLVLIGIYIISKELKYDILWKFANVTFAAILFYLLLFNVTSNSDWQIYEHMFLVENQRDLLFYFITIFVKHLGYEYPVVYKIHITLIGCGLIFFISRFSKNYLLIILTIILMFFIVQISNQIRYYLAFALFINSIYFLIVQEKKKYFLLFAVLSILSHFSILLLYLFLFFYYKFNLNKSIKITLLYAVVFLAVILSIDTLAFFGRLEYFNAYLQEDAQSTLIGGLFNTLIWIFWIALVFFRNRYLSAYHSLENDKKYQFLYKVSLFPIIFVPTGMFMIVFASRYLMPFLIVWIIFFFYSMIYENNKQRVKTILTFSFFVIITSFYYYILPQFLFDEKIRVTQLMYIVMSNTSINFLF